MSDLLADAGHVSDHRERTLKLLIEKGARGGAMFEPPIGSLFDLSFRARRNP